MSTPYFQDAQTLARMVGVLALDQRAGNYLSVTADMASATWNTAASHEVFTVTGLVRMVVLIQCTETLVDAADGASIQFGHESSTTAFIGSTGAAGAGGNGIAAGEIWCDTSPADVAGAPGTLAIDRIVAGGLDVGYEITGAALTDGTLVFHCWWVPISADGSVVAGAGGTL